MPTPSMGRMAGTQSTQEGNDILLAMRIRIVFMAGSVAIR
jgi:hypothetical protein